MSQEIIVRNPSFYSIKCANPECSGTSANLKRHGLSRPILCLWGARRQRFRCNLCKTTLSDNFFKFHYRLKHKDPAINSKIFRLLVHGLSYRKIAHLLALSEHCVRIRVNRMAQQAMKFHEQVSKAHKISEPICFDGLENFAASQYEPNNIQQAVGRDSLFIYDFNFASLNRKGRMSDWQKNRLAEKTDEHGRFNPKAIRVATREIIERLVKRRSTQEKPLVFISDEHFQYRRAIEKDLKSKDIEHVTISSKATRNYQNILFAINHADLLIRQSMAAFARETISFSKTAGRMCQKYALFMVHKNYMSAQFTKTQVRRPRAHLQSPAQSLGLFDRLLEFSDIFSHRSQKQDCKEWNKDWQCFWSGEVPKPYARSKKFCSSHFSHSLRRTVGI